MRPLERVHGGYVHGRRVGVLVGHLARLVPPDARVLDVGAGDGLLAEALSRARPDIAIEGIDPLIRSGARIPVREYDGINIPYDGDTFDAVLLVDVLHHTEDPGVVLAEAARVSRRVVLIKDHNHDGRLARQTLHFMDAVGNRRHGVALPFNYLSSEEWARTFERLGLEPEVMIRRLGLYPWPATLLFDRSLHFIARLRPASSPAS